MGAELIDTLDLQNGLFERPEWLIKSSYSNLGKYLGLARYDEQSRLALTDLGAEYVDADPKHPKEISPPQAMVLRSHYLLFPFKTHIINDIMVFLEMFFSLQRNDDKVPQEQLRDCFTILCGKYGEWKEDNTKAKQFYTYFNLCREMGLIRSEGGYIRLTKVGLDFIVHLHLRIV